MQLLYAGNNKQVAVIEARRFHVNDFGQGKWLGASPASLSLNSPVRHDGKQLGSSGATHGGGGGGGGQEASRGADRSSQSKPNAFAVRSLPHSKQLENKAGERHDAENHGLPYPTHAQHKTAHKGKGRGYLGVHRKDQIHHEFESEDQRWLGAVAPMLGVLLQRCHVNSVEDNLARLMPKLTQVSQARDELLHTSCAHLRTLLGARKVVFMEVDASNHFTVASTSEPVKFLPPDPEKFPGGRGLLDLSSQSKPIKAINVSGAALKQALACSLGDGSQAAGGLGGKSDADKHGRRTRDALGKEEERQELQRLGLARWMELLGPMHPQSALSCVCLDEGNRAHGAFVAVDHRVDALPHAQAMEFNATHSRMLENVACHVGSLLTHNEESTAKSERLNSSNELISALQDLALCTDSDGLFDMVRTRFPRLTGVQDMTLFLSHGAGRQRVLYSQESRARYELQSHLFSLFVSCPTSTQHARGRVTSNDLLHCLDMLRIVPHRIKTEQLYTILAAAKVPIQRAAASGSQGSGYSQRRKDDIDIVRFQKIFEAVASHLDTAMDDLLRTSDPHAANFCLPQRLHLRFLMPSPDAASCSADTGMPIPQGSGTGRKAWKGEEAESKGTSKGKSKGESKGESMARHGIAVGVATSAAEVIVAKQAYQHPHFCPEVDWPEMLLNAEEAVAAAARPQTVQHSIALQSVCSVPIMALLPNGLPESPPRVLGVLQAANKRNSSGSLNAAGFLETDVNQVRIIARTGACSVFVGCCSDGNPHPPAGHS